MTASPQTPPQTPSLTPPLTPSLTQPATDGPTVTIAQGALRGASEKSVNYFKGIPYAAAPFGANRFQAPQPAPTWDGLRDATEFGPTVPKPGYPSPIDELLPEVDIPGEDCLNLNVWAPDRAATADAMPVFVWIHGGAFVNGSGSVSTYDGSRFARDGVVCVTINYRLGVDGFALIEGAPANRGLLDQLAALAWVRDNIAAFGGDPGRVTVGGESAGAMSVTTLLSLPGARGLFHQAITQSGAGSFVHPEQDARSVSQELATRLGVEPTIAGFDSVALPELIREQARLAGDISKLPDPNRWGAIARNLMPFEPYVDGELVTRIPLDGLRDGAGTEVALLTGTNTDEHTLFLVPTGIEDAVNQPALAYILGSLGADAGSAEAVYRADRPGATDGQIFTAAITDWFFRIPAIRVAEARAGHGGTTYMYEFAWRSPAFDGRYGAAHALEIAFTFDNLDDENTFAASGRNAPQDVADAMHAAWVAFIGTGNPGWAGYTPQTRDVQVFGTGQGVPTQLQADPRSAERKVWSDIR